MLGTAKIKQATLFRDIYPFLILIWLALLDINLNKIIKREKIWKISQTIYDKKLAKVNKKGSLMLEEGIFSPPIKLIKNLSQSENELENKIPDEIVKETVNEKYSSYLKQGKNEDDEQEKKSPQKTKSLFSRNSNVKFNIAADENETDLKKKNWYKIVHYYENCNFLLKLKLILHTEYYLELLALALILWSYNLISTISSLAYLFSIAIICFWKKQPNIVFLKYFCIIFINFKYIFYFFTFSGKIKIASTGTFSNMVEYEYSIKSEDLPSSYFDLSSSFQEFYSLLLLFFILFALQLYIRIYLSSVRYISREIKKFLINFNEEYNKNSKVVDYNEWENKYYWFLGIESFFFQYFDKIVILSVGFFSIFDFYLSNFIIFVCSIAYIFVIDFQTRFEFASNNKFKFKYFQYLQYFSFLDLCFNHILLIPEISTACTHFLCLEVGSKSDKLFNIFIFQMFFCLYQLNFYEKYPEFLKWKALRVLPLINNLKNIFFIINRLQ